MFSRQTFWSGLGIGLIAGALLLKLMNVAEQKPAAPPAAPAASPAAATPADTPWDPVKMKELAERNNYVLIPKSEKTYTEAQLNDRIKEAVEAAVKSEPKPTAPAPVNVTIAEGYSSAEIADALAKAGIIKDVVAFESKIRDLNLEKKLNRGVFALTPGMSDEDVIAVIKIRNS